MLRVCYRYWALNAQSDSTCLAQARQNRSGKENWIERRVTVKVTLTGYLRLRKKVGISRSSLLTEGWGACFASPD